MELSSLAIIFVFVGNAAGIVMLVFMLFRLQNQSEATHEMLSRGNRDMTDSGKRLRDVAQQMGKLAEQIAELNGQAAEQRVQDQQRLGVQHGRMMEQLDRLAEQVARTQRLALDSQRSAGLAQERGTAPAPAVSPAMDDLLSQEVARLNTELERLRQQSGDEAARAAQQVQALTRQRDDLGRQLAQARDLVKRTQVEKDFIEDRLLALDSALTAARGSAPAALPPVTAGMSPPPPQAAATAPTS